VFGQSKKRANVNYVGRDGITQACKTALKRVVETQGAPEEAIIISSGTSVGLLLIGKTLDVDTVVMAGFGSGYTGEGPDGLVWAKEFLAEQDVVTDEVHVDEAFMHRLSERDLSIDDILTLKGHG